MTMIDPVAILIGGASANGAVALAFLGWVALKLIESGERIAALSSQVAGLQSTMTVMSRAIEHCARCANFRPIGDADE